MTDTRDKASVAHTAFALSCLLGDRICGIPEPDHEVHDEYLDELLGDVEQMRQAVGRLIDLLIADHPDFAADYAAHEQKMREAGKRHQHAQDLLRLAGDDPEPRH